VLQEAPAVVGGVGWVPPVGSLFSPVPQYPPRGFKRDIGKAPGGFLGVTHVALRDEVGLYGYGAC